MTTNQIWTNIIAYAAQIGLLVGIGAALPALLRLKSPGARLLYWQLLLAACLALPWIRPWHAELLTVTTTQIAAAQTITHIQAAAPIRSIIPPIPVIALWLLGAGLAARLIWLVLGMAKLARYRRHGRAMPLPPEWSNQARPTRLLISDEIESPVTFGFLRPVVVLPASFPVMPAPMRDAILFHELLHVERRDWLFTLGEEIVRTVFWFHPAIWWVLGEIQLAREQTVDREVIDMTQARDPYVDTLLAMAGVNPQLDLAPAPLFLRRRHLKERVMGIVQEVGMSKTRIMFAQIAALSMMALACWFITGAIPLEAQPQVMALSDGLGVTVNLNGSQLMHRTPVVYPADAMAKGVEGTVVVQVRLDSKGEVIDAAVLSGPDELRKGVQQSVLTWHFDKSAGSSTRVVNIDFVKPPTAPATVPVRAQIVAAPTPAVITSNQQTQRSQYQTDAAMSQLQEAQRQMAQRQASSGPRQIGSITISGLSDSAREQLLAQLPVHTGDAWSPELAVRTREAVTAFDSHLSFNIVNMPDDSAELRITTPPSVFGNPAGAAPRPMAGNVPPGAITVAGNVQAANLINATKPTYPPLAKMARQQGTVAFQATIGKDGTIEDLMVISGPPLLIPAALEAVKTWTYKPTLLNGSPVEVVTTIDVNFSLSQ